MNGITDNVWVAVAAGDKVLSDSYSMLRMQREELFELFTTELVLSLYSKTFFVHSNFVFHSLLRVDNFFDHAQIISRIIFMELVHCLKQPRLLLDPCNVVHILVKDRNMLVARLLRY